MYLCTYVGTQLVRTTTMTDNDDDTLHTRCAWAGGTCTNYPDFFENHHFHILFTVLLSLMYFFSKNFLFTIHVDS